jgi:hypothetical protein
MKLKTLLTTLLIATSSVYAGWFTNPAYNPDGELKDYGRHLPEPSMFQRKGWQPPSDASLRYYFDDYLHWSEEHRGKYAADASNNPYVFESELQEFDAVTDDLAETGLVSYLFYEDGKIKVDKKSPKSRFGDMFNDSSPLVSNSIGKSMASYVLGHAICAGHIKDVNEKIDWWLLKDTLYDNQRLLDLINMRARDQEHITKITRLKNKDRTNGNVNNSSILEIMSDELSGTKKSRQVFNYSGLPPYIVVSYVMYKVGDVDDFQQFLNDIFQKKVGIESEVRFVKGPAKYWKKAEEDGLVQPLFYASRYDYLRIAKAMLDDWNNDTCVGNYLKTIYENRERKEWINSEKPHTGFPFAANKGYGGFFHTDYQGYWGSPNIMAMDGYGGQMIWINFDDNRIVVANAIHSTYDWKEIVADTVRNGLR